MLRTAELSHFASDIDRNLTYLAIFIIKRKSPIVEEIKRIIVFVNTQQMTRKVK